MSAGPSVSRDRVALPGITSWTLFLCRSLTFPAETPQQADVRLLISCLVQLSQVLRRSSLGFKNDSHPAIDTGT